MAYMKAEAILVVRKAADYYINQYFGVSGVGLVIAGRLSSKTKSTACFNWMKTVWTLYYNRQTTINAWATEPQVLGDDMVDFTSCGAPPNTFNEILVEFNTL